MAEGYDKVWKSAEWGAQEFYLSLGTTADQIAGAVKDSFSSLQTNLGDMFFNTLTGKMGKFKDYVRAWAKDITRAMSDMMSKQLLGVLFKGIGGGITSLFSGGGGAAAGGLGTSLFDTYGIEGRQSGGIVTRPEIAMIGEAGPEAVVPLKNGKIPIEGGGSRNVNINFSISAMDGPSVKRVLYEERRFIENLVKNAIRDDRDMRGTLRKV